MLLEQALAIVTAAGFRVRKPKRRPKGSRTALNAIGQPYSPQFDPKYRIRHEPRTGHLFFPYSANMRFVGDDPPKAPSGRYPHTVARKRERAQASAPAWLLEADKLNQSAV
jgi:hypothetical protein